MAKRDKVKSSQYVKQRVGIVVLASALSLALGVSIGVLIPRIPPPDSIAAPLRVTSFTTSSEDFFDTRQVEIVVSQEDDRGLAVVMGGVLTQALCTVGVPVTSGSSNFAVNGVSLLNLATSFPLWRSLGVGDQGVDVSAVQNELTRLGFSVEVNGVLGWSTINAFNEAVSAASGSMVLSDQIDPNMIVWLPSPSVTPASCPHRVGDQVGAGQQLATLPPVLASVGIKALPAGLVAGDRTIMIDGIALPVDRQGNVVDVDAAQALTQTDSFRRFQADPKGVVLAGQLQLATPIKVVRVPPSAIFEVDANTGEACISAAGKPTRGSLVGSELGYTLMSFPVSEHVTTVDLWPLSSLTCR